MRLLGLMALCIILIVGLVFGYNRRGEIVDRFTQQFEGALLDETAVVDIQNSGFPKADVNTGQINIPMQEAGALNGLTGFQSFGRATFHIPPSARPRSGEVVLELAGALSEGSEGLLRFSVNGVRKNVQILDQGPIRRRIIVPLNTRELGSDVLNVTFFMEGQAPEFECTTGWEGAAALQVLPRSHLRLSLSGNTLSPSDIVALAGATPSLAWPPSDRAGQTITLMNAYGLSHHVTDVQLTRQADASVLLSHEELADYLLDLPAPASSPVSLDLTTTNGLQRTREFDGYTRWRIAFDRANYDSVIRALQLEVTLASTSSEDPWLVGVELNDRLLTSGVLDANGDAFDANLAISSDMLRDENVLQISLRHGAERLNPCSAGQPAIAELTALRLLTGGERVRDSLSGLRPLLGGDIFVAIGDGVGLLEGQVALDTLRVLDSRVGMLNLTSAPVSEGLQLEIVSRSNASKLQADEGLTQWLAHLDADDPTQLVVRRVTDQPIHTQSIPRAVLLFSHPAVD